MGNIYKPHMHCGRPTAPVDMGRCRAEVYDGIARSFYQCARKPSVFVDGVGYCKQHDPAVEAARRAASEARSAADSRRGAMGSYGERFMAALIKIRDGDNDPRETARAALEGCKYAAPTVLVSE